jgi:SAM-dependent methyltransferase
MTTHWPRHVRNWDLLGPPLRPHADVIAQVRGLIGDDAARCLLLGTTVEYGNLGNPIVAVDLSFPMLAGLWKADPARLGAQANWAHLPVRSDTFTHVLGDGSLNAVPFGVLPAVLSEVIRALERGGTMIARVFCRPDATEGAGDIRRDVSLGRIGTFHALKWRVAMSLLPEPDRADVPVTAIRDAFRALYPDRGALCRSTGWNPAEVDTIDVYDGSTAVYNFPTETAIVTLLRDWFTAVEIVRCGTYPLAERCPLLVARNPKL